MVTVPFHARSRRTRTGRTASAAHLALATALSALKAVAAPHKVSLARLLDMPLAVAGTGLIDFAAFHYVHMIGWLVTGVSLWLWNEIIADDGDA